MTVSNLLTRLRNVLADERKAIRNLDAAGIARASKAKEEVLERLGQVPPSERRELLEALEDLRPTLHANLLLLTHARAYLDEARQTTTAHRAPAHSETCLSEHGHAAKKTGS